MTSLIAKFIGLLFSLIRINKFKTTPIHPAENSKINEPENSGEFGYLPKKGHEWNPMRKFPRNESCWCGSNKKAKKCCLPLEPLAINSAFSDKAKPLIKSMRNIRNQNV